MDITGNTVSLLRPDHLYRKEVGIYAIDVGTRVFRTFKTTQCKKTFITDRCTLNGFIARDMGQT